jgi:hypothetical protein
MSEQKPDDSSPPAALHGYLIGELKKSDERQWERIDEHHAMITEARIRLRVIRGGVVILAMIAGAVGVWLRGGWEALAQLVWR